MGPYRTNRAFPWRTLESISAGAHRCASAEDIAETVRRKEIHLESYRQVVPSVWLLIDCNLTGQGIFLYPPEHPAGFVLNTGFDRVFCCGFAGLGLIEIPCVAERWKGFCGASRQKLEDLQKQLPAYFCGRREIEELLPEIVTVQAPKRLYERSEKNEEVIRREDGTEVIRHPTRTEIEWTLKKNSISWDVRRGIVGGWLHPVDMGPKKAIKRAMQGKADNLQFATEKVRKWFQAFCGRCLEYGMLGYPALNTLGASVVHVGTQGSVQSCSG